MDLADREELPKGKIQQPQSTRARSSIDAHEGIPTKVDNLDPHYGTPNSFAVHTEAKDPETSDAWGGQANFVTNEVKHTPGSRAKELAQKAYKKVQNEVLGGAPNNQTGV